MEKTGKWFNRNIHTEILPAETFYLAEDYHHKYLVQNTPRLWGDILEIYRDNPMGWIMLILFIPSLFQSI